MLCLCHLNIFKIFYLRHFSIMVVFVFSEGEFNNKILDILKLTLVESKMKPARIWPSLVS